MISFILHTKAIQLKYMYKGSIGQKNQKVQSIVK